MTESALQHVHFVMPLVCCAGLRTVYPAYDIHLNLKLAIR